MKIAGEYVSSGMSSGTEFNDKITELVEVFEPVSILETGTYHGLGTTQAILKGLGNRSGYQFFTIECNKSHARIARENINNPECVLLEGLSIPKSLVPKEIGSYPDHVFADHAPDQRLELYTKEVATPYDDLMRVAMNQVNGVFQFVVLDSAGHMGEAEFDYFMKIHSGKEFILCLDDTNHIKHFNTVQKIQKSTKFTKIWETEEKFGSAIYRYG